jgi:hypothetical protein
VLVALIFWHLRHEGRERVDTFDRLLTDLEERQNASPVVVAAAIRIAGACELEASSERVAGVVEACIQSLGTNKEWAAHPQRANELLRLVRALAGWRDPKAQHLLWLLATNRDVEVEWPAAKALAMTKVGLDERLREEIATVLEEAHDRREADDGEGPDPMSAPGDDLGNKVASLAWILPALRDTNGVERQLSRVETFCLATRMSPLRGEMSLAQGLKLAIVNERVTDRNVAHVRRLLFEHDGGLRFWHARLVLVQALLAHAWNHREAAVQLEQQLGAFEENHPLVKRGIELALEGLRERDGSSNGHRGALSRYMWVHERDAVKWVEQGKSKATQLAADVVLLSNMTYRLREKKKADKADEAAEHTELPRCIRKSSGRQNITNGCECARGLCTDPDPPAVLATRARFSENFCREQARLIAEELGPPPWTERGIVAYRSAQRLRAFWERQADEIARRAPA